MKKEFSGHIPNILIVEDEEIIAQDLARVLIKFGYNVIDIVHSGEELLANSLALEADLILMDIQLSGKLTGIQSADELRKFIDIPIIYITAFADIESVQSAKLTEPFAYIVKPFEEKSLHTSIEITLHKYQIDKKLKQKTIELEEEKKKSDLLIHNILPKEIVKELRKTGLIQPKEFKSVTLLFTDFQDFSTLVSTMKPNDIVNALNEIFSYFDDIVENCRLEKLKTIGDSYMAGCGFPEECTDHALRVIDAAIQMQLFISKKNLISKLKWPMRIGIHSGSVIAGVIGKNKMIYDVWGNTVNIAHRMESNGMAGKINISESTFNLIKEHYNCEYHDSINITEKNKMNMYFLVY